MDLKDCLRKGRRQMTYSSFEQGDIVILNLPFSDFSEIKRRPVLVISGNKFNRRSRDLIVAKITGTEFSHGFNIEISNGDLEKGELKKVSYIDLTMILTVDRKIVEKCIARVNEGIMIKTKEKLSTLFDIQG